MFRCRWREARRRRSKNYGRETSPGGDETILIIDDEEQALKFAGKVLRKAGYKTFLAKSGQEAIALYKERRDEIALVLLDLVMPEMDGREIYRALKGINPNIKALFSSGYIKEPTGGRVHEIRGDRRVCAKAIQHF